MNQVLLKGCSEPLAKFGDQNKNTLLVQFWTISRCTTIVENGLLS